MPVVRRGCLCVSRGPEDGRRFFVFSESFPLGLDGGGESGGYKTESGEGAVGAVREHFGGVGVDGSRPIACISSRSLRFSSSSRAS